MKQIPESAICERNVGAKNLRNWGACAHFHAKIVMY